MTEFPAVIDNSILNDFRACGRKTELAHFEHWKGKGENVHLHAGKSFAEGLEATRKSFFEGGFDQPTSIAHGLRRLIESYGNYQPPEGSNKTLDRMCGALEAYFDKWPIDQLAKPKMMPSGRYAIEFSFAEPLPVLHPVTNEPIIYAGRTDMICDFAGGTYLEDDKTASQLGPTWGNKWELRSQFTGYCWAAGRAQIPYNGVIVRGVSILKTMYGTAEAITYRSPWEIERWLQQTVRDLERMKRSWAEGYWDFNLGDACDSYGGCQFTRICKSPNPNDWLPMYFERRRWDPLERTETPLEGEWTQAASAESSAAQSSSF